MITETLIVPKNKSQNSCQIFHLISKDWTIACLGCSRLCDDFSSDNVWWSCFWFCSSGSCSDNLRWSWFWFCNRNSGFCSDNLWWLWWLWWSCFWFCNSGFWCSDNLWWSCACNSDWVHYFALREFELHIIKKIACFSFKSGIKWKKIALLFKWKFDVSRITFRIVRVAEVIWTFTMASVNFVSITQFVKTEIVRYFEQILLNLALFPLTPKPLKRWKSECFTDTYTKDLPWKIRVNCRAHLIFLACNILRSNIFQNFSIIYASQLFANWNVFLRWCYLLFHTSLRCGFWTFWWCSWWSMNDIIFCSLPFLKYFPLRFSSRYWKNSFSSVSKNGEKLISISLPGLIE